MILSEKNMSKLTNDELKEMIRRELMKEGIWDSIKHGLSKLPNLERNKWSKANKANAEKIAQLIDDNADNEIGKVAKILGDEAGDFAGFPNMKSHMNFLEGVVELGAIYDTLLKRNKDDKEMWPAPRINAYIANLRELVTRYLDYDLKAVYKHFKEDRDRVSDGFLLENQKWVKAYEFVAQLHRLPDRQQEKFILENQHKIQQLLEISPFGKAKWEKEAEKMDAEGETEAEQGPEKFESLTMKGLESNLLPMMLAAGGATAVLSQASWLKDLFFGEGTTVQNFFAPEFKEEFTSATTTVVESVQPGDGFTQVLGRLLFEDPTHFNQNMPVSQFFTEVKGIGITPQNPGPLQDLFADPNRTVSFWTGKAGTDSLQDAVKALGPNGTIGELFGIMSPAGAQDAARTAADIATADSIGSTFIPGSPVTSTGVAGTPNITWEMATREAAGQPDTSIWHLKPGPTIAATIIKVTSKIVLKSAARHGVAAGAVGALGATTAGAVAAGLGLGAIAAGAAVYGIRKKGQKSSRAQVLNDLLQTMQPVKPATQQEAAVEDETEAPSPGEAEVEAGEEEVETTEEGGLGTIHIYRPGGEDNDSLSQVLKGIGIPRWAHDRVTARIKKELETNGFEVLQEATRKLKPLPMKQRKKPSGKGVRGTLKRPWAGEVPAMIGNEPKSKSAKGVRGATPRDPFAGEKGKSAKGVRGATPRDPFAGEEDEMDLGLAPDEKPAGETKSQRDKRLAKEKESGDLEAPSDLRKVDRGTSPEKKTFKISDISDILKGAGTDADDEAVTDPVPQEKIRPTMKAIAKYLGPKLKQAGIKMRESVLLEIAKDIILEYNARQNEILQENRQLQRWKKISGILKG